jgi:uncharacterized protein (TIGR03118 family)
MNISKFSRRAVSCIVTMATLALVPTASQAGTVYLQTNLASDIPGMAANTDPNLKNPWGMSFAPTSPFWVSDQGTSHATLYNGSGTPQGLVVTTPPGPTGQVFNGTSSFLLGPAQPAVFLFSSLSGTISGWNPGVSPTTAVVEFTATDGAVYTGLASGPSNLYAADFKNAKIDVFDGTFAKTTLAGTFTDPTLPAGFSPYNIQNVGGKLYVEYALVDPVTHKASKTANQGIVDVYDTNGNFLQRLAATSHLSSPWGITLAPANFGDFSNDILVGNFGDGTISAFDPVTGIFQGQLLDASNKPITNDSLWALNFRAPASGFNPDALFFNAGINGEVDGLFGEIQVVPEPSTVILLGLGCLALVALRRRAIS